MNTHKQQRSTFVSFSAKWTEAWRHHVTSKLNLNLKTSNPGYLHFPVYAAIFIRLLSFLQKHESRPLRSPCCLSVCLFVHSFTLCERAEQFSRKLEWKLCDWRITQRHNFYFVRTVMNTWRKRKILRREWQQQHLFSYLQSCVASNIENRVKPRYGATICLPQFVALNLGSTQTELLYNGEFLFTEFPGAKTVESYRIAHT